MSRLLPVAVMLFSTWSLAEKPRISIVDFKGPKASAVRAQLQKKLCKSFKCVKPGTDGEVPVDAVVTGEISSKHLSLSVYYDEDKEPVTRDLKIKGGKLQGTAFKQAASAVREAVASGIDAQDGDDAANTLTGSP